MTTALALTAASSITSSDSASAVVAGCTTIIKRVHINAGQVHVELGGQRVTLQVCWDSAGTITSSSANQDFWNGPFGKAYAWQWTPYTSYSSGATGSQITTWTLPFAGQGCIGTKYSPLCTVNEEFRTTVTFYSPSFIGPRFGDGNGWWRTVCTLRSCKATRIDVTD